MWGSLCLGKKESNTDIHKRGKYNGPYNYPSMYAWAVFEFHFVLFQKSRDDYCL